MNEYKITVKYLTKDGKWVALVEFPDGSAVVCENRSLRNATAEATMRIEEQL